MNDNQPVTIDRNSSNEERQIGLRQIYQQVLERQPYEFERLALAKHEKAFLKGKLGVRHFIVELALSEVYLNCFYQDCSNYKFVELSFKHLLSRAPINNEEIGTYMALLSEHGMEAFVREILGSDEYRKSFGCFTVPYSQASKIYRSPRNYMQSNLLQHEHIGRRGKVVPTLYWQQLSMNCEDGHCVMPDANNSIAEHRKEEKPASQFLNEEIEELLQMLQMSDAKEILQGMNTKQRSLLRDLVK